jgi:selenide, water dikinase
LSDVYAMGGRPLTALSIVGFPVRVLPDEIMHQILRGGLDKMAEAGVAVIGGHSINDPQIKAGFAVTGVVASAADRSNAGATPGDRLVLTKPIGTGILGFAAQIGRASDEWVQAAARSMAP